MSFSELREKEVINICDGKRYGHPIDIELNEQACAVALVAPDGTEHVVTGHCHGRIRREASGKGGFGYDPLFEPDGYDRTFAELLPEEKNAISHRGRALAQIRRILEP